MTIIMIIRILKNLSVIIEILVIGNEAGLALKNVVENADLPEIVVVIEEIVVSAIEVAGIEIVIENVIVMKNQSLESTNTGIFLQLVMST